MKIEEICDYIVKIFYNTGHLKAEDIFEVDNYDDFEKETVEVFTLTAGGIDKWREYMKDHKAEIRAKFEFCKKFNVK